jgi:hypothetical protein
VASEREPDLVRLLTLLNPKKITLLRAMATTLATEGVI